MHAISEQTLASIGRMTLAATDLEHLLAEIGAAHGGAESFTRPGGALAAARAWAQSAAPEVRAELAHSVEAAATQLAISQNVLRRLWRRDDPADPAVFESVAAQLWHWRDWLQAVVAEHLGAPPRLDPAGPAGNYL